MFMTIVLIFSTLIGTNIGRFLEGELHTSENWAFLARFCFLSEDGQFEYYFEYNENQGNPPNLLLYYDTDDQWPAVYKTGKTCAEKESVLSISRNQILTLSTRYPAKELAGCAVAPPPLSASVPTYTFSMYPDNSTSNAKPHAKNSTTPIPPPDSSSTNDSTSTEPTTTVTSSTIPVEDDGNYTNVTTTVFPDFITTFSDSNVKADMIVEDETTTTQETSTWAPTTTTVTSTTTRGVVRRAVRPRMRQPELRLGRTVTCHNARTFRSSRERWWFIAVSNCNGTSGIHLKYRMLMTNGQPGDYWHQQFSADEFYILPVLMAFSIAYAFLILMIIICSIELKSRQLLHSTYKLFCLSVFVQLFGILLDSMSYLKYAVNGVGSPRLKTTGYVFMGISETCFLLLMLLLAKGYTVTRGRLPMAAGIKLTVFMCLYAVTYVTLFIYEAKVFDPGEVLYLYESPAGIGLIILRVIAWCMFVYSTVFTLKHYPEKANFYYPFNVLGTLWFIAGPAFILCANSYIDKWVRESVVCGVLLFISFGGHISFMLLTMPSVANKNFPYHVRTTQIGVMELTGTVGNGTIEQFGHHVYEPSPSTTTCVTEQTVIVPLTKRTEELLGSYYSQRRTSMRSSQADDSGSATAPTITAGAHAQQNGALNGGGATKPHQALEHVLNWTLAKNLGVLDVPPGPLPPLKRLGRAASIGSQSNSSYRHSEPDTASQNNGQAEGNALQEYIREVPIELFTVSRMVISNGNAPKPPHIQELE